MPADLRLPRLDSASTADLRLCTVYPHTERLTALARYLGRGHTRVEAQPNRGTFYAVVVNCLTSAEAIAHARVVHSGRPIIALVHSLGHPQAAAAVEAGALGLLSLCDPPHLWGECIATVTRGGRWLADLPAPGETDEIARGSSEVEGAAVRLPTVTAHPAPRP